MSGHGEGKGQGGDLTGQGNPVSPLHKQSTPPPISGYFQLSN